MSTAAPANFDAPTNFAEQRVARVYAEALLNLAEKEQQVADVHDQLRTLVQEVFHAQPLFAEFLNSAAISVAEKKEMLRKVLADRASALFFNFLNVLAEQGRLSVLASILGEYTRLDNERRRRVSVQVRTAVPLTDAERERIRTLARNRLHLEPLLEEVVDLDVLGGLVLRVGDFVFDSSIRSEINGIRKELTARSNHAIQSQRDRFSHLG